MKMNAFKQRGGLALAMLAAAVALNACGGGKQVKKFQPSNIVSFGDESSAFMQDTAGAATIKGLKYSVNALAIGKNLNQDLDLDKPLTPVPNPVNTTVSGLKPLVNQTAWKATNFVDGGSFSVDPLYPQNVTRTLNLDTYYDISTPVSPIKADVVYQYVYACNNNRLWIQTLASAYVMGYDQSCPLDPRSKAVSYAVAGAKVADVVTQISTNLAAVNSNTLVTVLAGQNDILERYEALYAGASTPPEGSINIELVELNKRGKQLGQAINTLANIGARTLVVTVPDLSYSPRVGADTGKQAVMRRLVVAFNEAIFDVGGARIDGHLIGLVNGFDLIGNMAKSPIPAGSANAYGLINVTDSVCASTGRSIDTTSSKPVNVVADLKYCNDLTLVPKKSSSDPSEPAPTAGNYLWAFDTWLAPSGHGILANAAFSRADNDTF